MPPPALLLPPVIVMLTSETSKVPPSSNTLWLVPDAERIVSAGSIVWLSWQSWNPPSIHTLCAGGDGMRTNPL